MAVAGHVTSVAVAQGAAGTTAVVAAPGAGFRVVIHGACLTISIAGSIKLQSAATDLTGAFDLLAATPFDPCAGADAVLRCAANEALNLVSTTGAAKGVVYYSVEATS